MTKPKTGEFRNCLQCGMPAWVIPARSTIFKYCSRHCRAVASHTQKLAAYKNLREVTCRCGKTFMTSGPQPAKHCSRRCYRDSLNERRRKNITNSQTRLSYYLPLEGKRDKTVRGKLKRRGLLERCTKCGYSEFPDILEAHHIDGNHSNNQLQNLTSLCPNCHTLAHLVLRQNC